MKTQILATLAIAALASVTAPNSASAQDTGITGPDTDQVQLFESDSSSDQNVTTRQMSTAELRQARALYRAHQRISRLEYNLWMGYEPLRPNWNAVPMMSSRYAPRRVYVPVYVHTR